MDLSTAQTNLTNSLAALADAEKAFSLGISDRQITHQRLVELRDQVTWWDRIVRSYQAQAAGGNIHAAGASWNTT